MTFSTNDFFCINFLFYWCHWLCYFIDMFALCLFRFILLLVIVFAVTILSNTKRVCVRVRWVLPSNPLALLFFFYFCFLVITFHLGVKMYVIQSISAMQHALMIRLWKLSSWRAKPVVFSPFLSFVRSSLCGKKIMNFTNFTPFTVACLRCSTEFLYMNQIK